MILHNIYEFGIEYGLDLILLSIIFGELLYFFKVFFGNWDEL